MVAGSRHPCREDHVSDGRSINVGKDCKRKGKTMASKRGQNARKKVKDYTWKRKCDQYEKFEENTGLSCVKSVAKFVTI